ncbi:MAG TPA: NAD-dependent epimerase/dehydratase family protein [Phnomibacter sp.]|nr:NAD-dependent epimerase/dehydratase family protein [Phnomibacter sp.]
MVLVTGGTGLLGAHLILELHRQGQVPRALFRSHIPEAVKDKAEWIKGDILDIHALEDALEGVEQVYHVAGYVSFSPRHRTTMYKINVEGTANVVNVSLDAGVKKLVHVSSVSAIGRNRPGQWVNEAMQWSEETSGSEYGRTKYLAEMEVWRGISEGLNAAIVNPTIVIGEHGDWTKGSMNIFRNIHKGFPWYTMGKTGFVDADDVARAMYMLMQSNVTSDRFILSAENLHFRQLFDLVADGFKVKRPSRKVTPLLAGLIWRLDHIKSLLTGSDPLVTRESAGSGMAIVEFDNSKWLGRFPEFNYTPIDRSVLRICEALKHNKH